MTAAAVVFCCVVALALVEGFGAPAFRGTVAADAFSAAAPLLGILVLARFVLRRYPARAAAVHRVHCAVQGLIVTAAFGWWWVEPHVFLTGFDHGSLGSMAWLAVLGAGLGFVAALLAERAAPSALAREVLLGAWTFFLLGGGRAYRAFDHVEAGTRATAATAIVAATLAVAVALWLLLRRRERVATALPALAPALACIALLLASRGSGPQSLTSRDSIVLVVVDTLRADIADGSFRIDPQAMPELARIAAEGVRFTQAVSPAPWTLPATVSLLSGWNPHRHRHGASVSGWEVARGDPAAMHLVPALRDAGYLTAAFVNNPWLRPWFGFSQGFYEMRPYHGHAVDGVALALSWLHGHAGTPSFCLLHLMDPHWPYEAPPGFGAPRQDCSDCDTLFSAQFGTMTTDEREEVMRRYAAEVRYTDLLLGKLYDTLASGGQLENTWLVITSDHGEELWEHGGFLHGHTLYDELLRVPLVVVPPRRAGEKFATRRGARIAERRGARIETQVRLEDVGATLLDIAGLDLRRAIDGKSLLDLAAGEAEPQLRSSLGGYIKSATDLRWSLRRPPWKVIRSEQQMALNQLFDLASDPAELYNQLFVARQPVEQTLKAQNQFLALVEEPARLGIPVARTPAVTSTARPEGDTRRRLESLGYAQ